MKQKALDVAQIILKLSHPEVGDIISNLKLQKLLYYAQGFHLAIHQRPLFEEDIKAWLYGPVVEEVYNEFKIFGHGALILQEDFDSSILTDPQKELIAEVYDVYGQFSALKLMHMIHEELPWKNTPSNGVIDHELMKSYFVTLIEKKR